MSQSTTSPVDISSREAAFLSASKFAVIGASTDDKKPGAQIFNYLRGQGKDVVPVNPNASTVQGVACIKSLADLPDPKHTAVSIVVRPTVAIDVLQLAKSLDIPKLWLQPGTIDDTVLKFIHSDSQFESRCVYPAVHVISTVSTDSTDPGTDTNCPCCASVIPADVFVDPTSSTSSKVEVTNAVSSPISTKRPREVEKIDTTSVKVTKTGSPSSPMTARSRLSAKVENNEDSEVAATLLKKQQHFLSAKKFAVVGASADENKYGYKIMKFLQDNGKDVIPINLKEPEILGVKCLKSITDLPDLANTAVSVVVPPDETLKVLQAASTNKVAVSSFWLQPGAQDSNVLSFLTSSGMEPHTIHSTVELLTNTNHPGCPVPVETPSLIGKLANGADTTTLLTGTVQVSVPAVTALAVASSLPCILRDAPKLIPTKVKSATLPLRKQTQRDEIPGLA